MDNNGGAAPPPQNNNNNNQSQKTEQVTTTNDPATVTAAMQAAASATPISGSTSDLINNPAATGLNSAYNPYATGAYGNPYSSNPYNGYLNPMSNIPGQTGAFGTHGMNPGSLSQNGMGNLQNMNQTNVPMSNLNPMTNLNYNQTLEQQKIMNGLNNYHTFGSTSAAAAAAGTFPTSAASMDAQINPYLQNLNYFQNSTDYGINGFNAQVGLSSADILGGSQNSAATNIAQGLDIKCLKKL